MKGKSRAENRWRCLGFEFRKRFQQGAGAARTARRFTRKQCNKAMRRFGKRQIEEGREE